LLCSAAVAVHIPDFLSWKVRLELSTNCKLILKHKLDGSVRHLVCVGSRLKQNKSPREGHRD
jgi:hypothetical protein